MNNPNAKKQILLGITVTITLLLITIGLSYAYFTANITGGEEGTTITVTGGRMNIVYVGGEEINALSIAPNNTPFAIKNFTVTGNNTTNIEMIYQISLIVENNFSNEAIKYKLTSINTNNNGTVATSVNNFANIGTGTKEISLGIGEFSSPTEGDKIHSYELKLYFPNTDYNQIDDQGKNIKAYINIKSIDYRGYDEEKEVNKPVLFTGMTPVKWSGAEFTNTTSSDPEWYDYENKEWANAKTQDGSYWIWIPRYAYKITAGYNRTETGSIDVKFLKGRTDKTADGTKIETAGYTASVKDTSMNYFLHPAFEFNEGALGFWVAKYEPTAAEGLLSTVSACNGADNTTGKTVKIAPNQPAWRCINVANAYNASLNMKTKRETYGWLSTEVDTHMMKNTEWGAVAYLSKSAYGAATEEVWNNAYNQYQTGCSGTGVSGANEGTCISYETGNGQKASTTYNIYGVYDMSGGAWERVMGNYNNLAGSSGLSAAVISNIDFNYLSRYNTKAANLLNGTGMNYDINNYGDAIYETSNGAYRYNGSTWVGNPIGSWYGDFSKLPYTPNPWFGRGGYFSNGSAAGLFYFHYSNGDASADISFRPVVFAL